MLVKINRRKKSNIEKKLIKKQNKKEKFRM